MYDMFLYERMDICSTETSILINKTKIFCYDCARIMQFSMPLALKLMLSTNKNLQWNKCELNMEGHPVDAHVMYYFSKINDKNNILICIFLLPNKDSNTSILM